MINGSPRKNGNIAVAFAEMEKVFAENDVEFENILLGTSPIHGCVDDEGCRRRSPACGRILRGKPGERGAFSEAFRLPLLKLKKNYVFCR